MFDVLRLNGKKMLYKTVCQKETKSYISKIVQFDTETKNKNETLSKYCAYMCVHAPRRLRDRLVKFSACRIVENDLYKLYHVSEQLEEELHNDQQQALE